MLSTAVASIERAERSGDAEELVALHSSDLAWLAETTRYNIFVAGLGLSAFATLAAALLGLAQPEGSRLAGALTCLFLSGLFVATLTKAPGAWKIVQTKPQVILLAAVVVAACAWLSGKHNQQYFFVIAAGIGTLGLATSPRWVIAASVVACIGIVAPEWQSSGKIAEFGFAVVVPPLYWLVVDRMIGFILRLGRALPGETRIRDRPKRASRPENGPSLALDERAETLHAWSFQRTRFALRRGRTEIPLTSRQLEATFYCVDGLEDAEIASVMGISVRQVRRLLTDARERSKSQTREQLAAWAVSENLLP